MVPGRLHIKKRERLFFSWFLPERRLFGYSPFQTTIGTIGPDKKNGHDFGTTIGKNLRDKSISAQGFDRDTIARSTDSLVCAASCLGLTATIGLWQPEAGRKWMILRTICADKVPVLFDVLAAEVTHNIFSVVGNRMNIAQDCAGYLCIQTSLL